MKRGSLLAAAAILVAADAFALVHAWRNRSGPADAEITLTERELPTSINLNDDDSGVSLELRWLDPAGTFGVELPAAWIDLAALRELGFDTSVAPSGNSAIEFYQRQLARRAFVALEYDGPAWRAHAERIERENARRAGLFPQYAPANSLEGMSHLVAVDASRDPMRLRSRYPDRGSVIIVPAVVGIAVQPALPAGGNLARPAQLAGSIQEIPSSIHVPRPFSDGFRRLPKDRSKVRYRVHLRYGASYEPWIAGVEFNPPANQ
jgi:Domain of unknown function (DUF4824)